MRENLFHGKRKDNGEWVDGYYCVFNGVSHRIYTGYAETDCGEYYPDCYEVIPETVGQYTELTDKNGKKIYEGDIVKMLDYQTGVVTYEFGAFGINVITGIDYDYLDSEIAEVTGCNNCSYFCRSDNFISLYELMWNYNQENDNCDVVEVIGNIYDNSELIKEQNK